VTRDPNRVAHGETRGEKSGIDGKKSGIDGEKSGMHGAESDNDDA
jgi:hypothetical protein